MLLYLDDTSQKEIAAITGLNTNAISVRINRMKKRFIKSRLED